MTRTWHGVTEVLDSPTTIWQSWRRVFLRNWHLQNFKMDILRSIAMQRGGLRNQQTASLCITATERGIRSPSGAFDVNGDAQPAVGGK